MVSLVTAVKDADRMREIVQVLVRHGMGELVARIGLGGAAKSDKSETAKSEADAAGPAATPADARITFAQRLRLVLQDLGPSFIKLGQIVSTRPDLIPAEVIVELKKLQDNVPPIAFAEVKAEIEETLGAPLASIYESFDEKPLASASIGQVHRARLRLVGEAAEGGGGDNVVDVVVKVQRPRIRNIIERDLDLLHFLARVVERTLPESRVYSPVGLVDEFDHAILAELDFTVEADHAERFRQNFDGHEVARFPKVYRQALGKKVITLEFLDGRKIYDAVAAGVSGEYLAKKSVGIVIKMIFEDGFFHADPHPGNIIILTPGEVMSTPLIGLIDLGLVGELSPEMRDRMVDLMVAAIRSDADALAEAMLQVGKPRGKVDMPAFQATVRKLSGKYLGKPLKEIEIASVVGDLVQGAILHGIDLPTELSLVGKSLMTIEGIGKELYPDLDVWEEARPYLMNLVMRRYNPLKLGNALWRELNKLSGAARSLPHQINEILDDLRRGELTLRTHDPELSRVMDRLGRRLLTGLASLGLLGAGTALLIAAPQHRTLALALLVAAAVLFAGHLVRDLFRG